MARGNKSIAKIGKATQFKPGHKARLGKTFDLKLGARDFILKCIGGDEGVKKIIEAAYSRAIKGSVKHQEILLNYILGRPTEKIKIDATNVSQSSPAVVKIIADTIRLNKLAADVEASPVISEDRIKEMEDILNKEIDEKE